MATRPYDDDGAILEAVKIPVKPPRRYQVVLLNDDFTPMDFVVEVLMRFFGMDEAKAVAVMMSVHSQGKGVCGVYSKEVAEMKVMQVNHYSRENQHPLQCQMEIV
ncbi:ATP-dependent Clp protease adapter ClpS [Hydrogenovibrio kuenenii]|uniref:ATP-dependent Clp protease adapter ClpS n=1 Tax=Hydrogenovibrio kuenenii TaxID=63658 RepID=UPI0004648A68|nr:ATP-dependent Clp protease adapter ClpS [Hydrogenovibrio kuenenii]